MRSGSCRDSLWCGPRKGEESRRSRRGCRVRMPQRLANRTAEKHSLAVCPPRPRSAWSRAPTLDAGEAIRPVFWSRGNHTDGRQKQASFPEEASGVGSCGRIRFEPYLQSVDSRGDGSASAGKESRARHQPLIPKVCWRITSRAGLLAHRACGGRRTDVGRPVARMHQQSASPSTVRLPVPIERSAQ